jgi:hypothetical protein
MYELVNVKKNVYGVGQAFRRWLLTLFPQRSILGNFIMRIVGDDIALEQISLPVSSCFPL